MVQSDALKNLLLEGYAPLSCILKDVFVFICAICLCSIHTKCYVLGLLCVIISNPLKM